jgi:hypothetical protein
VFGRRKGEEEAVRMSSVSICSFSVGAARVRMDEGTCSSLSTCGAELAAADGAEDGCVPGACLPLALAGAGAGAEPLPDCD